MWLGFIQAQVTFVSRWLSFFHGHRTTQPFGSNRTRNNLSSATAIYSPANASSKIVTVKLLYFRNRFRNFKQRFGYGYLLVPVSKCSGLTQQHNKTTFTFAEIRGCEWSHRTWNVKKTTTKWSICSSTIRKFRKNHENIKTDRHMAEPSAVNPQRRIFYRYGNELWWKEFT